MSTLSTAAARRAVLGFLVVGCVWGVRAFGAPVFGEVRRLIEPDGTYIAARIWGDEFYGVTESLDGYTLLRDPATRFFCYARLSPDGASLVSTGVRVGGPVPADVVGRPHVRLAAAASQAQARAARVRFAEQGAALRGGRAALRGPTTGHVQGICLIVDFVDQQGWIEPATVANFCNQQGFTGWSNNGSVRDYYADVSDGQLTYTSYVPAAYYRAEEDLAYYTTPEMPYGMMASILVIEALDALESSGFDFSAYDADSNGIIDAVNCYYAGLCPNNWAEGLWPHSGSISWCADGVCAEQYQITDMGSALQLATFCHENGHLLMGWPDLYDYDFDSLGVGYYCLMGYPVSSSNPEEPCAYLKTLAGWSSPTLLTTSQTGLNVPAAVNTCYKYAHPSLPNEYYLIENRRATGRDSGLPDSGLAIWHVDTEGDNSNQEMTPESHYLVTLAQADGHWDLENNVNTGDGTDLFAAAVYSLFTDGTLAAAHWWDGTSSGLVVVDISTSGATMTFDYLAPVPGDTDADRDVDRADFQAFVVCVSGPNIPTAAGCWAADVDGDGDVDLADFAAFGVGYGTMMDQPADMVSVPGGSFQMGDPWHEGDPDDAPVHTVYVGPYYLDTYEVTNAQYAEALNWAWAQGELIHTHMAMGVTGYPSGTLYCETTNTSTYSQITWNGSTFGVVAGWESRPVVMITWHGAAAYCNWRSVREGKPACYDVTTWACDFGLGGYRLPTEAEWEKAAGWDPAQQRHFRFGEHTDGCGTNCLDSQRANYNPSSDPYEMGGTVQSTPVGFYDGALHYKVDFGWPGGVSSYQTQDARSYYGNYDMSGNVFDTSLTTDV